MGGVERCAQQRVLWSGLKTVDAAWTRDRTEWDLGMGRCV